jgi:hypothetical protein
MVRRVPRFPMLLGCLALGCITGCDRDGYREIVPQTPGTITAAAQHVTGRQGDILSIGVWGPGIDWVPGTDADLAVSTAVRVIDSADYSVTHTMTELDPERGETVLAKAFEPGDYSLVFFAAESGQPPDRFAEVRVHVNGDLSAVAPAWDRWLVVVTP